MSATWSTYGRLQLMAAVFNADTFVLPAQLWAAVCLAPPHANDDGTMLVEPPAASGGIGYTRARVPLGSASWTPASLDELTNANPFVFLPPTVDYGLVAGWAITDTSVYGAGNVWIVGQLVDPFYWQAGQEFDLDNIILGLYD